MPDKAYPILVVDDDVEDHQILLSYFEDSGVPDNVVRFTKNGKAALEYLAGLEDENLPNLIVVDLNMPIMNGVQTLIFLKADLRLKRIPVIVYSTSVNPEERRKCFGYGAQDFLMKPMSYEDGRKLAEKLLTFV